MTQQQIRKWNVRDGPEKHKVRAEGEQYQSTHHLKERRREREREREMNNQATCN